MTLNRITLMLLIGAGLLAGCQEKQIAQMPDTPVDLAAEVARARAQKKTVVLEFTGSDWCRACVIFNRKVASQPEFQEYVRSNFVWIEIDSPEKFKLPPRVEATNDVLKKQFDIDPLPVFVALDRDGKEIGRIPAKDDADPTIELNPQKFIQ